MDTTPENSVHDNLRQADVDMSLNDDYDTELDSDEQQPDNSNDHLDRTHDNTDGEMQSDKTSKRKGKKKS